MGETICLYGKALPDIQNFLKEANLSRTFADVVLCCLGGERFLTHRLVLSAASFYLQKVLQAHGDTRNQHEPMTIVLTEIESIELSAILDFIYTGSAKVSRARLGAFLRAASLLQIGLPPLPAAMIQDTLDHEDTSYTFDRSSSDRSPNSSASNSGKEDNILNDICRPQESFPFISTDSCETRLTSIARHHGTLCKPDYSRMNEVQVMPEPVEERWWKERRRRHVANRVITASPWRQIVRPYHSPRVPSNVTAAADGIKEVSIRGVEGDKKDDSEVTKRWMGYDSPIDSNGIEKFRKTENPLSISSSSSSFSHPSLLSSWSSSSSSSSSPRLTSSQENEKSVEVKKEKPFRCADCGKEFSQLRNYKYHRSVHEGTREFAASCPECGKYFNDRGYLSSHMKIHRNRKEYGCLVCGKSFNQRVAYNMHAKIHTGLKPHRCEQCGKSFSRKMLLKQHLRTHSGERPYRCHICQKAFADRSNMTLHTKLHSGLKPYQCTLCSKAFTKKHHLKTHLNSHTGSKPYSCSKCGLKFSQSSNMRTHFKKCTRPPISETLDVSIIDSVDGASQTVQTP